MEGNLRMAQVAQSVITAAGLLEMSRRHRTRPDGRLHAAAGLRAAGGGAREGHRRGQWPATCAWCARVSWANIRDRVVVGHFDAAHMLGPMVVAETARRRAARRAADGAGGAGSRWQCHHCFACAVAADAVRQGAALGAGPPRRQQRWRRWSRSAPQRGARAADTGHGVSVLLPQLPAARLAGSGGIDPDRDVRLVVLPPPLLVDALRTGQVDGFCVGEPWNSLAVDAGVGVIVAVASDIWPRRTGEGAGHARAITQTRIRRRCARWCAPSRRHRDGPAMPATWTNLPQLLSEPRYVGVPARLLRRALMGDVLLMAGEPADASRGLPDPSGTGCHRAFAGPCRAGSACRCSAGARSPAGEQRAADRRGRAFRTGPLPGMHCRQAREVTRTGGGRQRHGRAAAAGEARCVPARLRDHRAVRGAAAGL